jgi:hypothetical protein
LVSLPLKKLNIKNSDGGKIKNKRFLELKRYWSLKIKSAMSMDFFFKFIFSKDENGPEIFLIAKKIEDIL